MRAEYYLLYRGLAMGFDMVRMEQMHHWVSSVLEHANWPPARLAGDASFRTYYRVTADNKSYVVMDAPPEKEPCDAYVAIDRGFQKLGLAVPEIYADDIDQGFLLLSDFGDRLYLSELNQSNADHLYSLAVEDLLKLQSCRVFSGYDLPMFDDALYQQEFDLFHDWFLATEKRCQLTEADTDALQLHYNKLRDEIKKQPKVCVHRDFHSRNLMVLPHDGVGILDFQDAVWGPVTYDILSLYRDCYIDWPVEQVRSWLQDYHRQLVGRNILEEKSFEQFEHWFDFASAQRHMKCVGIFSRLMHLYNKPSYHQYLPRTENYLKQVCKKHKELEFFLSFMNESN